MEDTDKLNKLIAALLETAADWDELSKHYDSRPECGDKSELYADHADDLRYLISTIK